MKLDIETHKFLLGFAEVFITRTSILVAQCYIKVTKEYQVIFVGNLFIQQLLNFSYKQHLGTYKAEAASAVFLILKKTYPLVGSVMICFIGGA